MMKVLVIGGGGREHALVWKLSQSPHVTEIHCAPGNGGIAQMAKLVPLSERDVAGLAQYAKEAGIDLTVVGPEAPLVDGLVDQFEAWGLKVFGPRKGAAQIEGSKSFAKELMKRYGIPTARYEVFDDYEAARQYLKQHGAPVVIKADGLAAGKGVVVAKTMEEAEEALRQTMVEKTHGEAGASVVIEEYLEGQEMTLMAFVQDDTVLPMVPAQDHKPVYDGDRGPNTGGMGSYSPVPQVDASTVDWCVEHILKPAARALLAEGVPFRGVLYGGLMLTDSGPKVIEFNARFGDPETQVVLPRLETDLLEVMLATVEGRLHEVRLKWSDEAAVCVVLASEGYPGPYVKGRLLTGIPSLEEQSSEKLYLFHAGTSLDSGQLVTSGGRVLGVTALGKDVGQARQKAYEAVGRIRFDGMHYRSDIGWRALS